MNLTPKQKVVTLLVVSLICGLSAEVPILTQGGFTFLALALSALISAAGTIKIALSPSLSPPTEQERIEQAASVPNAVARLQVHLDSKALREGARQV